MIATEHHYRPPAPAPLEILFADNSLLAVNKPSGLLTVPGRGPAKQDCLLARLQTVYPEVLVTHRLDMETSGIVLFARTASMQSELGKRFASRKIAKVYIAEVQGEPEPDQGTVDLPLIADWPNRPKQRIDLEAGKPSVTHYRVLAGNGNSSLVALFPETGRSHQLRVHMMSLGHPIIGDRLYGDSGSGIPAARLQLHAQQLAFIHPATNESLTISCPAPFGDATSDSL
jgi:tRNA pseudouridine32 synthase/23S rRNA pseudouridine746 synthase